MARSSVCGSTSNAVSPSVASVRRVTCGAAGRITNQVAPTATIVAMSAATAGAINLRPNRRARRNLAGSDEIPSSITRASPISRRRCRGLCSRHRAINLCNASGVSGESLDQSISPSDPPPSGVDPVSIS